MAEGVQRLAGDAVHQFPQKDEVDVGVMEAAVGMGAVLLRGGLGDGALHRLVGPDPEIVQAGGVGEQAQNGQLVVPGIGELGDPAGDRVAQVEAPLVQELHDCGGGGDDLGERGQVEDGPLV